MTRLHQLLFILIAVATGVIVQCGAPIVEDLFDACLDASPDALAEDADTADADSHQTEGCTPCLRLETYSGTLQPGESLSFQIPDYSTEERTPMVQVDIRNDRDGHIEWLSMARRISNDGEVIAANPFGDGSEYRVTIIR